MFRIKSSLVATALTLMASPLCAQTVEARIAQLEQRVNQLEQAVRRGGADSPQSFELSRACSGPSCTDAAVYSCRELGFSRAIPGRIEERADGTYRLQSVTCAGRTNQ